MEQFRFVLGIDINKITMQILQNFFGLIKSSVNDHKGKISHTRISSYIILAAILLQTLIFMGIEIFNSVIVWKKGEIYTIPADHLILFGMILAHHLALLGIYSRKLDKASVEEKVGE